MLRMPVTIKNFELKLYYFVWISTNLYALYKLWHSQNEFINKNHKNLKIPDLEAGWIINDYVDNSDIEWLTWKYYLRTSFIYLILQYLVSETIRAIYSPALMYWYLMSSISFIAYTIGIPHLCFALALPVIYASILEKNKLCVWTTSVILLLFYNYLKYNQFFWDHLSSGGKDEDVYMILFAYGWIELRCISFTLDYIDKRQNKSAKLMTSKYQDILSMFAYVMYLPLFFNGPHILYEDFEKCYKRRKPLYEKLQWFATNIAIFLSYMFLLELSFHYIYFMALKENIELIKNLPTIALCGGGLFMGLEFHMKYVISYGMSGAFALLDNIDPPPTPRCIARIHVYSQMWRHFDVGLYKFLIKYIYKPCLGFIQKYSLLPKGINKLLASLSTFLFILMWHGTIKEIFIWAALNFIGITCESLAHVISKSSLYAYFKNKYLKTDAMEQRFIALLCAPLLAVSAVSNFYLFAGLKVGNLFVEHLCPPSFNTFVVLLVALYSCCQVSISIKDVPSRTYKTIGFTKESNRNENIKIMESKKTDVIEKSIRNVDIEILEGKKTDVIEKSNRNEDIEIMEGKKTDVIEKRSTYLIITAKNT